MKLRLKIITNYELRDYSQSHHVRFAVVDLDKSKKYPNNFVCILPKNINPNGTRHTKFERIFEDNSSGLAKRLLKKTLRSEKRSEIKAEIKKRLERLYPKPAV